MKLRNIFKKKFNIQGTNNICNFNKKQLIGCIIGDNNELYIENNKNNIGKININIAGSDNKIIINNLNGNGNCYINIKGDNNVVEFNKNVFIVEKLKVQILENCKNARIGIGENTSFWNSLIQTCDNESSITIGKDCMFSYNTVVFNTDGHSILKDNLLINKARNLVIADHVWIGFGAVILKNSKILSDSIIGYNSVVSGRFKDKNIVLAGNPAKIVKTDINWDRRTPNELETLVAVERERERERVIFLQDNMIKLRKVA